MPIRIILLYLIILFSGFNCSLYAMTKGSEKEDWVTNGGTIKKASFKLNGTNAPGITWSYTVKSSFNFLGILFEKGQLSGLEGVSFWAGISKPGKFAVILTEKDESNYQTFINLSGSSMKEFFLPVSDFLLDPETNDENKKLDAGQIYRVAIVDISGITGDFKGRRSLSLSELNFKQDISAGITSKSIMGKRKNKYVQEIYTMNIDGTDIKRLTFNSYAENHAHLSPDKKNIIFTAFTKDTNHDNKIDEKDIDSAEVGIMDANGQNYRFLTNNNFSDFGAVWSPDSKSILFTTNRFGQFDLATIDINGNNFKRLTSTPLANEMDPHWVLDIIVFNKWFLNRDSNPGIWKMKSNGKNLVQLTNTDNLNSVKGKIPFGDMDPKISPDGKMIAFERHLSNRGNFGFGDYDIYIMDINGKGLKDISKNDLSDIMPVWSPDSRQLAFWTITKDMDDALDIYLIDKDGLNRAKVTKEPDILEEEMPSFFSSGKILFSAKARK